MALTTHSFEPYHYQEYPKMVYVTEADYPHKGLVAKSPEHEADIRGDNPKWEVTPFNPYAPVDTGEKKFLFGLLDKLGAQYDKDAPISELRELVDKLAEEEKADKEGEKYDEPNILEG